MSKIKYLIDDLELEFEKPDEQHPWPYYEELAGADGIYLSLAVPKDVPRDEIQAYIRKFRNNRDLVGYQIYRI